MKQKKQNQDTLPSADSLANAFDVLDAYAPHTYNEALAQLKEYIRMGYTTQVQKPLSEEAYDSVMRSIQKFSPIVELWAQPTGKGCITYTGQNGSYDIVRTLGFIHDIRYQQHSLLSIKEATLALLNESNLVQYKQINRHIDNLLWFFRMLADND